MNRLKMFLNFVVKNADDVTFFCGMVLLGYGLSHYHEGLGPLVCGALLILYVWPLIKWVK